MESHARVVIVGGGIMGVGLAFHLCREGWSDVVPIEKGELTSGSTWHTAGQCPHFNGSLNLTKVHVYGTELYPSLEQLTGVPVSWHGCGGLRLATTDDEVDWLKHVHGISRLAGYEAHLISPDEIREHHPFLDPFGVKLAFLTVTDGHVAPADVTNAMAAGARANGAMIHRRCRATDIKRLASGERQVITEQGTITCEHVVNAAGSFADVVAGWTGHVVPIANMLHHYVITEPVSELVELERELPVVRDPYAHAYTREETNGLLVGPLRNQRRACVLGRQGAGLGFRKRASGAGTRPSIAVAGKGQRRLPLFGKSGIKSVVSGAITHTPDANFLLGPAHGPRGYWMANGASVGICRAPGRASISPSGWSMAPPT